MTGRTPEAISRWLDRSLYRFDGPAQYLGTEPGAVRRPWDDARVRVLLTASWDYSQASGNMAVPAVYRAISDASPTFLCDRWYLPASPRDMGLLEKADIPVFGIESRHPLRDFDVVGTSISYTVLFMNFCKALTMSGVPLRRRDRLARAADYPMVLVGGQAYCAPEFMSPVVDCVWLGEVEDEEGNPGGIGEVLAVVESFKADGSWSTDRIGCYERLALRFSHLYFPEFTEFTYGYVERDLPHPVKMVTGHRPLLDGMAYPHRARKVKELDKTRPLTEIPLLFTDPGMGAGDEEVARGCVAWCVFCRLSWVSKPQRQHSVEYSVAQAKALRLNTGLVDVSLVAPDPPAHTEMKNLIAALLEGVTDEVDASSMRVDDYIATKDLSLLMSVAGTDSITLGLEGNSQRMRDLAGKGTSDDDVAAAVTKAIRAGIRKIKLYMISNWPGEETADVMRIVELGRRLADIRSSFGEAARGVRIQFSWTPLLIEAQTPLQWFAVTAADYTLQKALDQLRDLRIDMKIGTKANPAKLAFFQACQRSSRAAGEAIVDVIEAIGTASWGGFPRDMRDRLSAALVAHGFLNGIDDLFGERYRDDLFGWEHIDTGVKKSLMWQVYADMVEFLENTDAVSYDDQVGGHYHGQEWVARCDQQCQGSSCGACDRKDLELRRDYIRARSRARDLTAEPVSPVDHTTVSFRLRLRVERPEQFRFVAAESWPFIFRAAAYRACEAAGFPAIAKRSVRMVSDATSYRERSAGVDYIEFGVTRQADDEAVRAFLEKTAAEMDPYLLWDGTFTRLAAAAKFPSRPVSLWELEVADSPDEVAAALRRWNDAATVPVLLRSDSFFAGSLTEPGDAKAHVADFWVVRDGLRVVLRMVLTGRLGPYQAYAALMGKASWIEAAARTAMRLEFFGGSGLACTGCGSPIPSSLMDVPYDDDCCPRCKDQAEGKIIGGLARTGVLEGTANLPPVLTGGEKSVDSPSFTKPAHQFGQSFGDTGEDSWAGQGFTGLTEESAPQLSSPDQEEPACVPDVG
jgi:radical SAM superfamily enzyme YgiQ (UPF0313 family)